MAELDPRLQQVVASDPALQQLLANPPRDARREGSQWQAAIIRRLAELGVDTENFKVTPDGRLEEKSWLGKHGDKVTKGIHIGLGGIMGAGALSGGSGGAAAASSSGLPVSSSAQGISALQGLGGSASLGGAGTAAGVGGAAGAQGAAQSGSFLGTLGKLAPAMQNLAPILGGAAGGASDTAAAKSTYDLNRYNTEQRAQMDLGQLDLQRKAFDENSEASRMKRALISSLLGNYQPSSVEVPGIPKANVTGGLQSALGGSQSILQAIQSMALQKAQAGNQYQGGQVLKAPDFSGGGNKFLDTAATAASILGAFGKQQPRSTQGVPYA